MFVTFTQYTDFGYSAIPEEAFGRLIYKAGYTVIRLTFGRVTEDTLNPPPTAEDVDIALIERNKRGVCEIAELLSNHETPVTGEMGAAIKAFTNEGYSETLADTTAEERQAAFDLDLSHITSVYFTREQLYRGGGA